MSGHSDYKLRGGGFLETGDILVDGLLMELARGGATGVDERFVGRVMESIAGVESGKETSRSGEKREQRINWWKLVPLAAAASLTMVAGMWWFSQRLAVAPAVPLGLRVAEVAGTATIENGRLEIENRGSGDAGASRRESGARTPASGVLRPESSGARPLVVGMQLRQGERVVVGKGGKVGLKYDGEATTIELLAASEAGFGAEAGAKRVNLAGGTLVCTVAPQPADRPMLLDTPQAEAKVLGTRFTLEADAEATRIEVTAGLVRMTRSSDKASVDVAAGHEATVSNGADPRVEAIRAQGVLLDLNFEDRTLPEGSTGTIVEDPHTTNSRFCVAGVRVKDERFFRVRLHNADRGLFTYREGSVLSFDYWVKAKTDAMDVFFWNATRSVSPGSTLYAPAQEQWTHVAMRLSDFNKESRDGDLITEFVIQTTSGGNELFVDNIRIEKAMTR